MANIIQSILTTAGRAALAKSFGNVTGAGFNSSSGLYFKIGTGGYVNNGGSLEPVTPDTALTDLQAGVSGTYYYKKTFVAGDVLFIAPATIQFRCLLDLPDANGAPEVDVSPGADGPQNSGSLAGSAPKFFEIGIFDAHNIMVAYGTFPEEVKLASKSLNHLVSINF